MEKTFQAAATEIIRRAVVKGFAVAGILLLIAWLAALFYVIYDIAGTAIKSIEIQPTEQSNYIKEWYC